MGEDDGGGWDWLRGGGVVFVAQSFFIFKFDNAINKFNDLTS